MLLNFGFVSLQVVWLGHLTTKKVLQWPFTTVGIISNNFGSFYLVNSPAGLDLGCGIHGCLAGTTNHRKSLAVSIHDAWDYVGHFPIDFIWLTH